ncbi:hypothetical protein WN55_05329 [Dufourea novaeangliae]|uniref:Uncharacterized protein n=1 Tax=Dufourea novaeangliae TaxID=178035 RepID=A0A154PLH6_DUFNO|nr:hypothetical protein WN55_05329 [Dufourea novaeangliae]
MMAAVIATALSPVARWRVHGRGVCRSGYGGRCRQHGGYERAVTLLRRSLVLIRLIGYNV